MASSPHPRDNVVFFSVSYEPCQQRYNIDLIGGGGGEEGRGIPENNYLDKLSLQVCLLATVSTNFVIDCSYEATLVRAGQFVWLISSLNKTQTAVINMLNLFILIMT